MLTTIGIIFLVMVVIGLMFIFGLGKLLFFILDVVFSALGSSESSSSSSGSSNDDSKGGGFGGGSSGGGGASGDF